ncbi:MAG TPA: peptidylprolyl isomerase [Spirochaetota bacterium]|nr:peptidylprolyl isomerase [Spirochaetota bacterium]
MRYAAILSLILLLPLSCKKGNDVFASIDGGVITRSEFNDWLESRKIPVESVYKDRYSMSDYLRQLAVEKLTAIKAEKNNYNNEKIYKTIENNLYKNHLAAFFINKRSKEIAFNEKGADLSIIRLFIKKADAKDRIIEEGYKKRIMANLLAELKTGKDFNELAAKYSEDAAAQKKGHLGIVPENILEVEIKNAVDLLKENDYTKEPVIAGKSLCLIKLHKRYDITEKNIKNIVTDKSNAERIIDFYKNRSLDETLNRILKEKRIVSKIDTSSYKNSDEVIFSIDGERFTSGYLEDILNLFYSLKYGMPSTKGFSVKEKRITSEKIFREHLFASEGRKEYMEESPVFQRDWFYLRRATLAGAFKYSILMKKALVTDEETLAEYIQNKTTKYYKIKKMNNKEIKVYLAFKDIKNSIKNKLGRDKLKSLKKQWDKEILSEGNYKIVNKDFLIN